MEDKPVWQGPKLTDRQWRCLGIISTYVDVHNGRAPTLAEVAALCGMASKSTASLMVHRLAAKGVITYEPHIARGISIVRQG
jgi:Mn-dependent DtxR family transcriptional regulator